MPDTGEILAPGPAGGCVVRPGGRLSGDARVPGDKSISHRALILSALAAGETLVSGLNAGADVAATRRAVEAFGARVDGDAPARGVGAARGVTLQVRGTGGVLTEPADVIDAGNSGTTLRLLAGVAAAVDGVTILTGDASLRRRPVDRVAVPLSRMGAECVARAGGRLPPLVVRGGALRGIVHELPIASAQVKSALLLAGLAADGVTYVTEPLASRDHTERMLPLFGITLDVGTRSVSLKGPQVLRPPAGGRLHVPGDPSAAAFLAVAALLVPESDVTVRDVCVNPTRTGWIDVLRAMGARIETVDFADTADESGEPVASIRVCASALRGVTIEPALVPLIVDEVPILAVAAACAAGTTRITGAAELRAKESDRIATTARALAAMGVAVDELPDGLVIHGRGGADERPLRGGARIASEGDHRIAMAFAVAGLAARGETTIDDVRAIATSFPGFSQTLSVLAGAR